MGNRVLAALLFLGAGLGAAQEAAPDAESIIRRSLERDSMNASG